MTLRVIELILSNEKRQRIRGFLEDAPLTDQWETPLMEGKLMVSLLVDAGSVEEVLDLIADRFSSDKDFRVVVQHVEASLPVEEEEEKSDEKTEETDEEEPKQQRISRQELHDEVSSATNLTRVFVAMVVLSTIVAAVGLLKDNLAVIIGAMVIAPLLGPNVALSLSSTLGDVNLARRALRTGGVGTAIAFVVSAVIGLIFRPEEYGPEIMSRTTVGFVDIALALVAGAAGSLAFTTGISSALVGVMVAVALLPPLAVCGLLVGAGQWNAALGALLLLFANLICINLAGVVTFAVQGIRPKAWYEAERARRATRVSIAIWLCLVVALILLMSLAARLWSE